MNWSFSADPVVVTAIILTIAIAIEQSGRMLLNWLSDRNGVSDR